MDRVTESRPLPVARVQRCGPHPCDCSEEQQQAAAAVQRLTTPAAVLGLQRASGNLAVSRLMVQREAYTSGTAKKLLTETRMEDVAGAINGDHGPWLRQASDEERVKLLNSCFHANDTAEAGLAMDVILHRTPNQHAFLAANVALWQRVLPMLPKKGDVLHVMEDMFLQDTENVALGYMKGNEQYCVDTLASMAYDRSGKPMPGQPTADQQKVRSDPAEQKAAETLVGMQQQLAKTRTVKLGTRKVQVHGYHEYERTETVWFDPKKPPPDDLTKDPQAPAYATLKQAYDLGAEAVRHYLSFHPLLYILVREDLEDSSRTAKAAADKSPDRKETRELIAAELVKTLGNIETTRGHLNKTVAGELAPIHRQLRAGESTSPANPERNWGKDPVWRPLADRYIDGEGNPPWWEKLLLASLEMGVYVIAGLATGGIGFAVAMALKGAAEAAMAVGKAQLMDAASQTSVSDDTKLADAHQAKEAWHEAAMAIAFAALDAAMVGVEMKSVMIAGRAVKAGEAAATQAIEAIEMSGKVLEMERRLLGKVDPAEVAKVAEDAAKSAGEVRKLAGEARAAATKAAGKDAQLETRAKVAEQAADRAEAAAKRIEKYKQNVDVSDKAKQGVPKEELTGKGVTSLTIPMRGGGQLIISKTGLYICTSPCMKAIERFTGVISRNPELAEYAGAVKTAEADALKAIESGGLKAVTENAVERRLKALLENFTEECTRFERAEKIAADLNTSRRFKDVELNAAAVVRIIKKGSADPAKGQLLEEISAVRLKAMLADPAQKAKLAGQHAGETLEYIPGHRIRDTKGRQLTDGVIGFWKGDTFKVVTVIEAKAGRASSEGLKYSKEDLGKIMWARWQVIQKAERGEINMTAKEVWGMGTEDFVATFKDQVDDVLRKSALRDPEWKQVVIDDARDLMATEMAAIDKKLARDIRRMRGTEFVAKYPARVEEAMKLVPLPEGGQLNKDFERFGSGVAEILDTRSMPGLVQDGKAAGAANAQGTWRATDVAAGRGSQTVAVVAKDADVSALARNLGQTEKLGGGILQSDMTGKELADAAQDILNQDKKLAK